MKKLFAMLLALAMLFSFAACAYEEAEAEVETEATETEQTEADATEPETAEPEVQDIFAKGEGVMTYAEYAAADIDSPVVVECFVQAHQSWWEDQITVYAQDQDGAYFMYNMACSEADAAKLVPGTKIKVTGYKSEWAGEVEITDATFEIEEGSYIAEPIDVTELLGTDALIEKQNMFVSFTGLTVEPSYDAEGNAVAYLYKWNGTGVDGDDLYFNVSYAGKTYNFTVESYLCGAGTEVYEAVKALKIGDEVDLEGYLYWYEGVNPHITAATVVGGINVKGEGVMTYAEYAAAELDSAVVVECYVQAHQSWWDNKITVYAQDGDGAYFMYNMECAEEDAAKLVPGTKIKVTGYKSEWAGEVEITDATFEIEEGSFIAPATNVTDLLGTDALIEKQNMFVSFKNMVVEPSYDAEGNRVAFLYKWNGTGVDGDDLYFNVSSNGKTYNFTVESYLCGAGSEVYEAVKAFKVGDIVDLEGFLYWYEGVNPHITAAAVNGNVNDKAEGVMTYAEYDAAELDSAVVVECYVQAHQSWWEDQITVYAQDGDGAYFMYNMACTQEDADKLVPGTKIKVTGYKSEWAGEVEITDATFEIEEGSYIAPAVDVTALLGTDALIEKQNCFVSFKGMTVEASTDANGNEVAFLYKWNGTGADGDDLYFNVSYEGTTYTFTVESYLCGAGTEVYEGVKGLKVGDVVDLEGYLYWYEGVNPHITAVVVK